MADKAKAKGAKVLEDVSAAAGAPQVTQAEVKAKAKKNATVTVMYLDAKGAEHKGIPEDVSGVHVTVAGKFDKVIGFADLPLVIQAQALAFGLNTVLRNEVNTTYN